MRRDFGYSLLLQCQGQEVQREGAVKEILQQQQQQQQQRQQPQKRSK